MIVQELRKIFDDKEFVLGVMCDLDSDKDIETVLTFIRQNKNVEAQDIILLSLQIAKQNEDFNDLIIDDFNILQKDCEIKK